MVGPMKTVVALRNYLMLAAAVLVLAAIPVSERLAFDQRIESFFADDNPDLQMLRQSRRDFGGDEFVVVAWTEDRLFNIDPDTPYPATLDEVLDINFMPAVAEPAAQRIEDLTSRLNDVEGVNAEQTQHLHGLLDDAPRFKPARRAMTRLFEGTLVGKDGRTTGILLQLLPEAESEQSRGETLHQIRAIASDMEVQIGEIAVAGEPVQVFDMFEMVEQDGQLLFLVSLAILSFVVLLMFRGLRWVLAAIGLVLGSVVITRAILVLVGAELSMVSSMLNSLVTVIGIATCMHVIVHYRDLRAQALKASAAIGDGQSDPPVSHETPQPSFPAIAQQTLRDMAVPVFWTCVTTAVGFGSLLVSQITPVRSFATMMCLATMVVMVGCLFVLPATLASGSRLRVPAQVPMEHWLDKALHLTCRAVETRPVISGLICFALFAGAVPGILNLTIETDFSKNFRESSTIVQSLQFVERRLGGAGSWEISFDTPEDTSEFLVLNDDFLSQIRELTDELRELTDGDDSIRVLSLTDIGEIPPRRIFGTPTKTLGRIRRMKPQLIENFYNKDAHRMRIVLRSTEQQSSESKSAQIVSIRKCVREFFERQSIEAEAEQPATEEVADSEDTSKPFLQTTPPQASGMFVLLAELILSLLNDQLLSFLVACGGILCCMTIAFRSLRIGLISLFPNIFPVAIVMGILGWIGSPVNIGTAMITSVSMGLTVDSTIHYITAFERARRTHSVPKSLQMAHAGAGRAVVFAHLALVAGFLVLTASRFIPLVYFGALLSLSMIGGVFGDLVLLPLLLRWTTPATRITES